MTAGSDNVFPKLLTAVQSSDPAAPSDGSWKVYSKPGGIYARSSNSVVGPFAAAGANGITVSENRLTGDVNIAAHSTYYDGPSLSLAAGSYIVDGHVEVTPAAAAWITVKLMNGSTCEDAAEGFQTTATAGLSMSVHAYIVLVGTTTVKIQAAVSTPTTGTIRTTPALNNTGTTNKGSYLRAVKIA